MNNILPKRFVLFFVILAAGTFATTVLATPSSVWLPNFAGITTAIAEKDVTYSWSPNYYFNCYSRSRTQYPIYNITKVGYNSFSCHVWRDGAYADGWTRATGSVNWNNSHHADWGGPYIQVWPGSFYRQVVAAGVHDFGHFDGQSHTWNPSLSASGTYRP